MKIILALTAASLLMTSAAVAQTYPVLQGRPVLDAANIIPQDREDALNARLMDYQRTTGHQLAVVTVASLEDYAIEDYSIGLARKLALGNRDADDGILYLIAPNERTARVEVGYGLEPILTDGDTALMQANYGVPAFKAGDYPKGIEDVSNALMAKTQMDRAGIADLRQRQAREQKIRDEKFAENMGNFFMTVGLIIAGLVAAIGSWWAITEPGRRRRRAEEEARVIAARDAYREEQRIRGIERQRRQQEADRAAQAERRRQQQERQDRLNAMSPRERERFLAAEAAAIAAALAADQERQRLQRIRDEERRRKDAADRAEESRKRAAESYTYGSSNNTSSNDDTFGGGGGSFGGGGSTSSW